MSQAWVGVVAGSMALLCAGTANATFLQTDPIGYKDDMNLYAYVGNDPLNRTDPTGTESWLVTSPIAGRIKHTFVVVADKLGGRVQARYSYGPDKGVLGGAGLVPSKLTAQTGSGSVVDRADTASWNAMKDPAAAAKAFITAAPIPASDASVMAAGASVNKALGTNDAPGNITYTTITNPASCAQCANSNSAAFAVVVRATEADRAAGKPAGEPKLPPDSYTPGWGQYDHIPKP